MKYQKPKDMIPFFKNLFEKKYKLTCPKMTVVKDGIYIYGCEGGGIIGESRGMKIFIEFDSFVNNTKFYETHLENCHDTIINKIESLNKKKYDEEGA